MSISLFDFQNLSLAMDASDRLGAMIDWISTCFGDSPGSVAAALFADNPRPAYRVFQNEGQLLRKNSAA